jgi:hypothetical protein
MKRAAIVDGADVHWVQVKCPLLIIAARLGRRAASFMSLVLGNSAAWSGDNVIAHGVMRDAIDLPSVIGVLRKLDFKIAGQLDKAAASRILAVLAKAEASRSGAIRGVRHVMWEDSDIQASRHARARRGCARRSNRPHRPVRLRRRRAPGTQRRRTDRGNRPPPTLNGGALARQLLAADW